MLVTGGAGFVGRWVVKHLIAAGHRVLVLDNLENGSRANLAEVAGNANFGGLIVGGVEDAEALSRAFAARPDVCIHAAAQINVHESLQNPLKSMRVNVQGTWQVLEQCRRNRTKCVVVSTCMVYDELREAEWIDEAYPAVPRSPYAGSKLAAELLAESYGHAYGLPVAVLRPFNIYGPFQKPGAEGGVVSVFLERKIAGEKLPLFGGGTQTRDLLYVEDAADFIVRAALSEAASGHVINAGTGCETSVRQLAELIGGPECTVDAPHPHPQSEIPRLRCNARKAAELLGWQPQVPLEEGVRRTEMWLRQRAPAATAGAAADARSCAS